MDLRRLAACDAATDARYLSMVRTSPWSGVVVRMRMRPTIVVGIVLAGVMAMAPAGGPWEELPKQQLEECTIGVASGRATADGRPLVWKTRDADQVNNEVVWVVGSTYRFLAVVSAGSTTPWMGVNEKGFAILNSLSSDLPAAAAGPGNGTLMKEALGTCASVAEFQTLLDRTNLTGRTTQANFAVIDSTGAAAIFETAGTQYWKYDANDSSVAPQGYVLRTNFALHGGGSSGIERYRRTTKLIADFWTGDTLGYRSILRTQMRDFSDANSNPVPVPFPARWQSNRPFGYIYCYLSICRSTSVAAAVIQGVRAGEPARLSTMWAILGQPAGAIAVPYWPVGNTPPAADGEPTAPLCDAALAIKSLLFDYAENNNYIDSYKLRDGKGGGFWPKLFAEEDAIFATADSLMVLWRATAVPPQVMLQAEAELATRALSVLHQAYEAHLTSVSVASGGPGGIPCALSQPYPNPCNTSTSLALFLPEPTEARVAVYDVMGEQVAVLCDGQLPSGEQRLTWDGRDDAGRLLPSGVYFVQARTAHWQQTRRCVLVR
ncbi:MAG: T9SS type A sorting domain-containing protein [Calditrichaeota bacterium]|nr:T9SS type A sorting domain-containing protein [Calditrichota bacterium]